uniref:calcium-binding protein n=1 Tax=Vampirovibrio sp. TaxID=2717857 RepID=UPI00359402FB
NDTYLVDTTTDVITENLNEGTDTVQSSVSYVLGNNLENLTLTGPAVINGVGNTLNNLLTGNGLNNILNGATGNDSLNGNAGNDTLIGGTGNDFYLFKLSDGRDLIQENDATAGNVDRVQFDRSVVKGKIAIFKTGSNLEIAYQGNTTDKITVQNHFTTAGQVERFELSTGQYMTNADVNLVIQNMTSYASSHGISMSNLSTVQNNQALLNIVAAGFHS